jgi:thiamine monophosphate synthase
LLLFKGAVASYKGVSVPREQALEAAREVSRADLICIGNLYPSQADDGEGCGAKYVSWIETLLRRLKIQLYINTQPAKRNDKNQPDIEAKRRKS